MHFIYRFLLIAISASSVYSATVQFQTTFLGTVNGQSQYRNIYTLVDAALQANQALDIDFDAALYGTLSNAQGPAGFDILLLQPNNPPGSAGLFSSLALSTTQPPMSFAVRFIFRGTGLPSTQHFAIDQYNAQGGLVSIITSGFTTPAGTTTVPEPGGFLLSGLGVVLVILGWRGIPRPSVRKANENL